MYWKLKISFQILLKNGPYGFYIQLGEDRKGYSPKRASVPQVCLRYFSMSIEILDGLLSLTRHLRVYKCLCFLSCVLWFSITTQGIITWPLLGVKDILAVNFLLNLFSKLKHKRKDAQAT